MKITVVGAGNMGLCLLGHLSLQGHEVTLFTSSNKLDDKTLILKTDDSDKEAVIKNFTITNSIETAFRTCELIFCTYPAFLRKTFIASIETVINPNTILCFVPGYGGAEFFCTRLLERGVRICGFQRVPYVARYDVKDKTVIANILSKKRELFISTIPIRFNESVSDLIEHILNIPTTPLHEYLAVTLSPSNPLLHISGIYNVFRDSTIHTTFQKPLKFYEEWNDITSTFLMEYDDELHRICNSMKEYFKLNEVVPLSVYYESPTPVDMSRKLKSIEAFKVVMVPLKELEKNKYVVDLNSRMFIEDFPYGVCMFKAFAILTGVETPIIDNLLEFYAGLSNKRFFNNDGTLGENIAETGIPQLSGFDTIDKIYNFYMGKY